MNSVSVSYLEDKKSIDEAKKGEIIHQEIEQLLKSKVNDSCEIPYYDAFYGSKNGFLPNGDGYMRMDDRIVIQSTWNNGVINGELVVFDVVAKRVLAYMDVVNGVITNQLDVTSRDTMEDVNERRIRFKTGPPFRRPKDPSNAFTNTKGNRSRTREERRSRDADEFLPSLNPTIYLHEYTDTLPEMHTLIKHIVISRHCLRTLDIDFVLSGLHRLIEVIIMPDSLHVVKSMCFLDLNSLRSIEISNHCCNSKKEKYQLNETNTRTFRVENCPALEELSIGSNSFYDFSNFAIISSNSFSVRYRLFRVSKAISLFADFYSLFQRSSEWLSLSGLLIERDSSAKVISV